MRHALRVVLLTMLASIALTPFAASATQVPCLESDRAGTPVAEVRCTVATNGTSASADTGATIYNLDGDPVFVTDNHGGATAVAPSETHTIRGSEIPPGGLCTPAGCNPVAIPNGVDAVRVLPGGTNVVIDAAGGQTTLIVKEFCYDPEQRCNEDGDPLDGGVDIE